MTVRACQGCGSKLPPRKPGAVQKWCTDACRQRTVKPRTTQPLEPYPGYPGYRAEPTFGNLTRLPKRFWSKAIVAPDGCWEWLGTRVSKGYGRVRCDGVLRSTHRTAYEAFNGSVPDGLHLDHLCRNRACCNPDHLEPVTNRENSLRGVNAQKTHCAQGHPFSGDNLYVLHLSDGRTRRKCKACKRARADRDNEARRIKYARRVAV